MMDFDFGKTVYIETSRKMQNMKTESDSYSTRGNADRHQVNGEGGKMTTVDTFEDLRDLLEKHPEWLNRLHKELLEGEATMLPDDDGVTLTEHCHIVRKKGVLSEEPVIKGTRVSVRVIVNYWRAGYSPEEIPAALPHLSNAEVFDALSYFSDHMDEISEHIARNRMPPESVGNESNPGGLSGWPRRDGSPSADREGHPRLSGLRRLIYRDD